MNIKNGAKKLSSEDRLASQLESIVSSVIKALEGLEKELSEYIEITNKRLQVLEDKVQKFESLADIKSKGGLVKAIESSSNADQVKQLAHLTQRRPSPTVQQEQKQPPLAQQPIRRTTSSSPSPPQPMPRSPQRPETSQLPPIPKPPSIGTTLSSESIKPPTINPQTHATLSPEHTLDSQRPKEPIKPRSEKKEDDDKEELMSALKVIDSL